MNIIQILLKNILKIFKDRQFFFLVSIFIGKLSYF